MKGNSGPFLLALFLLSFTPLKEIIKVPVLIHHFNDHRKESCTLSFVEFLKLHYSNNQHIHHENGDHQNIPFKQNIDFHTSVYFFKQVNDFSLFSEFSVDLPVRLFYYTKHISSDYLSRLYQPPRLS